MREVKLEFISLNIIAVTQTQDDP